LIVAALGVCAGEAGKTVVSEAVKDAYATLKAALTARFKGRASATVALTEYERKPQQWAGALEAELIEADAGRDTAVIEAARRVMTAADPAGAQAGKYLVDARGAQGVIVGEHATQTNTFGSPPAAQ